MNEEQKKVFDDLMKKLDDTNAMATAWQRRAEDLDAQRSIEQRAERGRQETQMLRRFRLSLAMEMLAATDWIENENVSTDVNIRQNCRIALRITDILIDEANAEYESIDLRVKTEMVKP